MRQTKRMLRHKLISDDVKNGEDISKIVKKYDVGLQSIRIACIEFGVQPPGYSGNPKQKVVNTLQLKIVKDLLHTNYTASAIAKQHNVPESSVLNVLVTMKKVGLVI